MTDNRQLILETIKQYPLYSVDKLNENLEGVSRHTIQRVLEENDLSTAEKRLTYSRQGLASKMPESTRTDSAEALTPEAAKPSIPQSKLEAGKIRLLSVLRRLSFKGRVFSGNNLMLRLKLNKRPVFLVAGLVLILLVAGQGFTFWNGSSPEINLEQPAMDYSQSGEKLFIIGRVEPKNSQVMVNDQAVSLNGDGTFTTVVEVPLGESIVRVNAKYWGKESDLLRLVSRQPTEEERQALAREESKKKLAAADEAAKLESKVEDLLAAKEAVVSDGQKGYLQISNNEIKEEEGFSSVVGEVVNLGPEPVSWVMVTVQFIEGSGNLVDTRHGFATEFEEVLKPGDRAEFKTQSTQKEFDYYQLELSWEEESSAEVAGTATGSAEILEEEEPPVEVR